MNLICLSDKQTTNSLTYSGSCARNGQRGQSSRFSDHGRTSCQASFPSGDTALTRLKVHDAHQSKNGSEVGKSKVPGPGSNVSPRCADLPDATDRLGSPDNYR
jgi:hypothetical protein